MPYLSKLTLTKCTLDRWPTGLFAHPRTREFKLLLDGNPLRHIPDVAPGSDKAAIVARTSLTLSEVSTKVAECYNLYLDEAGLTHELEKLGFGVVAFACISQVCGGMPVAR